MKTALEKIDWLEKNGIPNETEFIVSDRIYIFMGLKKNGATNPIVTYAKGNGMGYAFSGDYLEIVTPPKKTRKLYLWDYRWGSGDLWVTRTNTFFCEHFNDGKGDNSETLRRATWRRKVVSSMIEVDEDGNILDEGEL